MTLIDFFCRQRQGVPAKHGQLVELLARPCPQCAALLQQNRELHDRLLALTAPTAQRALAEAEIARLRATQPAVPTPPPAPRPPPPPEQTPGSITGLPV